MDTQTWYTILGGLISGLVGLGLFSLQRSKASKDEEQRVLFQIYQLMVVHAYVESRKDTFATISLADEIAESMRYGEIRSLSVRVKDVKLAAKIALYPQMVPEEQDKLRADIAERLNKRFSEYLKKPLPENS